MMESEVVGRRRWLTREEFLDFLGAANLIPGPNSTELALHVGHRRAGFPGLLVAGAAFILPAVLIVLALAAVYVRFQTRPELAALFRGVKPVVVAVVLQALWALARTAVKSRWLGALGLAAVAFELAGVHELVLLAAAGALAATREVLRRGRRAPNLAVILAWPAGPALGATAAVPFSLAGLFFFFLKVGAVLYGSGYVLLAFLRADLVERLHWLTEAQLLDAVAVGQFTPGPVFTTATFLGYLMGGTPGAALATVGIFLPAFFFVAISGPLVPRLRRSPVAGAFLDGVNVASLALMAVVTARLGRAAIVDLPTLLLALASAGLLLRFGTNSAWLLLLGALVGLGLAAVR
jgi:chromate transporter